MERQEIPQGSSGCTGSVYMDIPKLGDGSQDTQVYNAGRVETKDEAKRKYHREYRLKNPERFRDYGRRYVAKHKDAVNACVTKWRKNHRKKYNEAQRRWRERNLEKLRVWRRNNYSKNRHKIIATQKASQARHKTKVKERARQYRIKNKGKRADGCKAWIKANPEKVQAHRIKYLPRRRKLRLVRRATNPVERIKESCRARVYFILKKAGIPKFNHTFEIIGCTPDFFKAHIESQFEPWMSWDNYGEWEIDHIIPISKFNLADESELFKAFHYSNCQPLREIDNMIKGDRIVPRRTSPTP